ncbi:MAG TPA: hypothetical protein PKG54_06455 [Phycisphaerae bacterium]|jgi:hypothetical protein|nr:hypothetical protein [Phycisphaerae bacterium]HOB74150.1 hypothetical protein [Phycisphaerae bacterium]HOJ55926.1 hypothetical protein [Phycisphaerae bacterium]HOL27608.1 hypothetical protein [Phycisphaerae bacterium]HPP22190.1 hypothetical protein [Phycisphaerae bacterium]
MNHEGTTPDAFRLVNRFPAGKEQPANGNSSGSFADPATVADAMLEACGLGGSSWHDLRDEQPAAHFYSVRELPGPYISLN